MLVVSMADFNSNARTYTEPEKYKTYNDLGEFFEELGIKA